MKNNHRSNLKIDRLMRKISLPQRFASCLNSATIIVAISLLSLSFETAKSQWSGTDPVTTTAKVGVKVASGISNALEVNGSELIGSSYAGSSTTGPTNGLAIQGRLGIGTTSPSEAMDVLGNIRLTGTDGINPTNGRSITKGGTGRLNLYSGTNVNDSWDWIEFFGNTDNARPGELTLAGKYINFMDRTDASGGFTVSMQLWDGKLAVGSGGSQWGFNPTEVLDVAGNVKFSGALMPNGNAGTNGQVLASTGPGTSPVWAAPTTVAGSWLITGNAATTFGTNFIGTTDGIGLMVKTNSAERASFLSGGNFRVGATSSGVGHTPLPANQLPPDGIIFSGDQLQASFDLDNSDPLWISRHNIVSDRSELRVMIGDNATTTPHDDFISFGGGQSFTPPPPAVAVFLHRPGVVIEGGGWTGHGTLPLEQVNVTPPATFNPPKGWAPGNVVDIFKGNSAPSAAPASPVVNGPTPPLGGANVNIVLPNGNVSGLRLSDFVGTNLAQWTAAASPPANNCYLSVNNSGDVILARCTSNCIAPVSNIEDHDPPVASERGKREIENLYERIAALEAKIENLESSGTSSSATALIPSAPSELTQGVQFYQNDPNPFSESTDISFVIPQTVRQATLIVSDRIGHIVYSQLIEDRGESKTTINGSSLSTGTYLYSIVADGIHLPGKKMVLLKGY
jgi:hypothetical protein